MKRAPSIRALRTRARDCRACDLWKPATQTVFGEGPDDARLVLLGEEPGDAEDRQGHPFVGPAGQLLKRALSEVGVDWKKVYMTNVVSISSSYCAASAACTSARTPLNRRRAGNGLMRNSRASIHA